MFGLALDWIDFNRIVDESAWLCVSVKMDLSGAVPITSFACLSILGTLLTGKLQLSSTRNASYFLYQELSGSFVKNLLVDGICLLYAPLHLFLFYQYSVFCCLCVASLFTF